MIDFHHILQRLRPYIKLPYQNWSVEQFLSEKLRKTPPPDFDFVDSIPQEWGLKSDSNGGFLWSLVLMLCRSIRNNGQFDPGYRLWAIAQKGFPIPCRWITAFPEILEGRQPLILLAQYPEPASRAMASIFVQDFGYGKTWKDDPVVEDFLRKLPKMFVGSQQSAFDWKGRNIGGIPIFMAATIADSVKKSGMEYSEFFKERTYARSEITHLYRFACSLYNIGSFPIPEHSELKDLSIWRLFWTTFLERTPFPEEYFETLFSNFDEMPLIYATASNLHLSVIAERRMRLE